MDPNKCARMAQQQAHHKCNKIKLSNQIWHLADQPALGQTLRAAGQTLTIKKGTRGSADSCEVTRRMG